MVDVGFGLASLLAAQFCVWCEPDRRRPPHPGRQRAVSENQPRTGFPTGGDVFRIQRFWPRPDCLPADPDLCAAVVFAADRAWHHRRHQLFHDLFHHG